ncbi:MAG: phosphoenolpyruvate carboxykinase (ATP) [Candidatus Bathyarchaeia archaeon]
MGRVENPQSIGGHQTLQEPSQTCLKTAQTDRVIPPLEQITIEGFKESFNRIIALKEKSGVQALLRNPPDLLDRAKLYGLRFKNGSWGWASNIWHRSEAGSVVVERDNELAYEHKLLMLRVLEHILAQGPLIQVDAILGKPGSKAEMRCRLYCDPQFPDIAYRWSQLCFPSDPSLTPDVELFCIPHYLGNPATPGNGELLKVLRFPHHDYTIVTCSSYQGEVKKGFLSHWIYHVYKMGGTGEHASLREFTVKRVDGGERRVVMCIWALTGAGKSTHGMYVFTGENSRVYWEKFKVNPLSYVREQVLKNDDIIAIFEDQVIGSERGSWTKTEDVDENQAALWRAAMSPRALHENTEFDSNGNPSLKGELFQYYGSPNRNARSVFYLEDTGYFNGDIASSGPLNTAVFISPGYLTDYAWVKINDPAFAAKVLADGRTVGHPAQSLESAGLVKYDSRFCLPFTMGVKPTAHVVRFYELLEKRKSQGNPIEVYQLNTIGRVGAEYRWRKTSINGETVEVAEPVFENTPNGDRKPIGGSTATIEETELFILQAARGAVEYKPHPIWGEKVLTPVKVEGIPDERLKELNPFTYRSLNEMKRLLEAQIKVSKFYLDKQCPELPHQIYESMDLT